MMDRNQGIFTMPRKQGGELRSGTWNNLAQMPLSPGETSKLLHCLRLGVCRESARGSQLRFILSLPPLPIPFCTNWSRDSKDLTFPVESGHQELPSTEAAMNMHLHPFGLTQKLPTGSPAYRTTPLPGYWTTINQGRTGLGRSTT